MMQDLLPCRSLKSWISAHQPPVAPKLNAPMKGLVLIFSFGDIYGDEIMDYIFIVQNTIFSGLLG